MAKSKYIVEIRDPNNSWSWEQLATVKGVTLTNDILDQIAKEALEEYVEETYFDAERILGEPDGFDEEYGAYWERDGENFDETELLSGPQEAPKVRVKHRGRLMAELTWGEELKPRAPFCFPYADLEEQEEFNQEFAKMGKA